ncbi:MAG TPA: heme-dependent oxidative N-demethylase subunit alpha family protein [Methylibium sp.]|uniref:heme-dependent oxidative N-demethylase subunit alpha family protein n=1 Tax=Methylibium sp. TaxID=2067992 RepID=UPI002DBE5E5D|nr:heme-dependent oxidative N-demethylase subunit alpha family protein [Methylibium sp.]HEU4460197.1 heme-dependent oxidative N-demethylase subunit alpha family protein [Methylibium sp.]
MHEPAPAENDGFDFEAAVVAPFRMRPGLRRLAPLRRVLHELDPRGAVFAEKLGVLAEHADAALVGLEGSAAWPALRDFVAQAADAGAPGLQLDGERVRAASIGWGVDAAGALEAGVKPHAAAGRCLAALPPARRLAGLLALTLHEDLALVEGRGATMSWMAVCLPSHWSPAEKVGRPFAAVHHPVPDNATLIAAAEHLCRLVCEPQRWERFVWNLTPHAGFDQHPQRHPRMPWPRDAAGVVAQAHWRTEHQSFVPLPALKQAMFTIHVEVVPLARAITTPARAARLHAALASMSDPVLAYRGLVDARAALLDWLAARAAR